MKKILVLATGGTIASIQNDSGLKPGLNVQELLNITDFKGLNCSIEGRTLMNIDSTNMTPDKWFVIAKAIEEEYDKYDGFVVTHGTDTMAYTSAALRYIMENLDKPVIVTGSQYPITEEYTDAIQNFTEAIQFATENIAGVFIVFDGDLIVGTRAVKLKTRSYDAFESVNFPVVGNIKHNKISYNDNILNQFLKKNISEQFRIKENYDERILVLKLFPGMSTDIFDYIKHNYTGLIVESYGIGGIPSDERNMSGKIKELVDEGLVVILTTQCLEEGVEFGIYEVGNLIPKEKVVFAGDINTEALVAKTIIGMGNFSDLSSVKKYIETPYTSKL